MCEIYRFKWLMQFAGIRTKRIPGVTYKSALAFMDIYNPHVQDGTEQLSAASIIMESRDANSYNQIQVGWMVINFKVTLFSYSLIPC